jgi:MFS family permease
LSVRAGELGVPTALLPVLWCAWHVAKSSGNLLLGRAVDQFGPRPFLFLGWLVFAATYLALALATAAWQVWAFFLAYGLVVGLIEPAERTLVANLVGGERKGRKANAFDPASLPISNPGVTQRRASRLPSGCRGVSPPPSQKRLLAPLA